MEVGSSHLLYEADLEGQPVVVKVFTDRSRRSRTENGKRWSRSLTSAWPPSHGTVRRELRPPSSWIGSPAARDRSAT
jgi:hypothetical protein